MGALSGYKIIELSGIGPGPIPDNSIILYPDSAPILIYNVVSSFVK